MIFNSIEFAIYLVIVFLLYWKVFNRSVKVRNIFVIAVSYIFYGWWSWRFLILIAFTTLCSYLSGIGIARTLPDTDSGSRRKARWICGANITLNLAILGLFKYYNFFMSQFAEHFLNGDTSGLLVNLILPVGISFYTFQALSYSIDVYRRKIAPTHDITAFFAYVAFFPQLVAGPIERATNLLPQFYKLHTFNYQEAVDGMRRMLWGLFKKVVVADNCARIVNHVFENYDTLPGSSLLLGAVFFSFQIYGDFSGYSDMAIGIAKLFGISLMDNFKVPYLSRSIPEFWRRWHISLTTWFRDYLYIPLGGSRVGKHKAVRNTFAIFLVSGIWHGANWTFLIWGGYHAMLFLPSLLRGKNRKYLDVVAADSKWPTFKEMRAMALTFCLVIIGWIIFRAETITDAWLYIKRMFSASLFSVPRGAAAPRDILWCIVWIAVMLVVEWIQRRKDHGLVLDFVKWRPLRWALYYGILIAVFFSDSVETFIYFQF
ncbi:MAG: MBOAT family protein [Muribaculaceae bacterium]|nr:MBOAT family protein [Muribaculaceae bacterium]